MSETIRGRCGGKVGTKSVFTKKKFWKNQPRGKKSKNSFRKKINFENFWNFCEVDQKTPKKNKRFFQFFPRGWFFQNFFLVKTLLVPTFPPHLSRVVSVIFVVIFMILGWFRRFWSYGVGFQAKKWLFLASITVRTPKHIISSNNLAENKVKTVKTSKSQESRSDFPAIRTEVTVQVYP